MHKKILVFGLAVLLAAFTACEREDDAGKGEEVASAVRTVSAPAWWDALSDSLITFSCIFIIPSISCSGRGGQPGT